MDFSQRLNPCRRCGKSPYGDAWYGDETMHMGSAFISCKCGEEMELDVKIPSRDDGYGHYSYGDRGAAFHDTVGKIISQWNRMNPKEETEPRIKQDLIIIEERLDRLETKLNIVLRSLGIK